MGSACRGRPGLRDGLLGHEAGWSGCGSERVEEVQKSLGGWLVPVLVGEVVGSVDDFLGDDDDLAVGALAVLADVFECLGGSQTCPAHEDSLGLLDDGSAECGCGDGLVGELVPVGVDGLGEVHHQAPHSDGFGVVEDRIGMDEHLVDPLLKVPDGDVDRRRTLIGGHVGPECTNGIPVRGFDMGQAEIQAGNDVPAFVAMDAVQLVRPVKGVIGDVVLERSRGAVDEVLDAGDDIVKGHQRFTKAGHETAVRRTQVGLAS
jgi:hypothetical protein